MNQGKFEKMKPIWKSSELLSLVQYKNVQVQHSPYLPDVAWHNIVFPWLTIHLSGKILVYGEHKKKYDCAVSHHIKKEVSLMLQYVECQVVYFKEN